MGNEHQGLNGKNNNDFKNSKNKKYAKGQENNHNSEEQIETEGDNHQISEYDKELSSMLYDEDSDEEEEENNKNKKANKKKSLKEELDDYAKQIAEEKFMEEINRSKSIRKNEKNEESDDDDDDEDDYEAFKRWKLKQKNKKKTKEGKGKNEKDIKNNNIKTLNNIDTNQNLNIDKEIKNKKIKKNKKKEEKKRANSSDKLNIFTNNIKEKNAKINKNNNTNNKKEKDNDNDKIILTAEKEEFIKQSMKNYILQNQTKTNTLSNNGLNTENNLNNKKIPNLDQSKYSTNTYNPKDIKGKTLFKPNTAKEEFKSKKSQEIEKPKKSIFSFFKKKNNSTINKNIYKKVNKENIRTVTLYMKNGNIKYEEGLQLCGIRNYNKALVSFLKSRNSFLQLSQLMKNNPKDYPEEFRKIINERLLEKLKLANQSIRECNNYIKDGKNLQNTTKANDILKNLNFKQDNKINNNFSQIDDSFDFNSDEPDPNPVFRNRNQNPNLAKKNIHQEEDSDMDAKVESEIMMTNPGVKFSDIIGMEEMKKTLYEIIIVPSIRPDFFTGIRKPQRGILLFGPPGTGKTMIAKAIASECKSTFFNISASSLTSKWVGESEKTVKSLFKLAYRKSPSIIFIDEIDSILSKRTESENEATKRLKTEFLIQFDGLGSNNDAKLLVIAATNRPMDLDEALLRRLPKRIYCGPLDQNGRFDYIKKVINKVECNLSDKDIMEIAKMTNGYSNSDLKELCKEAAYQPVRELTMEQILKIKKFRPLVKKDLVLAVNKIRGSLNKKIIEELLKWNEQFGGI